MIDFVHCLECGYEPPKEPIAFEDVALAIRVFGCHKPMRSLGEALDKFVEVETLDDENQYMCEKCDKMVGWAARQRAAACKRERCSSVGAATALQGV